MTEHDDLIREAREVIAARAPLGGMPDDSLIEALADALEARPSLVVRGEEELQVELDRHEYAGNNLCECGESMGGASDGTTWTMETNWHLARALIANGVVTVAPSLDDSPTARADAGRVDGLREAAQIVQDVARQGGGLQTAEETLLREAASIEKEARG